MNKILQFGGRWRFALGLFLLGVGGPGNIRLHAQGVYTAVPGETSIYSNYDPTAAAPRTPATRTAAPSARRFLPAMPEDQYLARKAEMAGYSRSSFTEPAQLEITPAPRAATTAGPIASAPTTSFPGIPYTTLEPPTPDTAVGPSDVVMVVNSTVAQFTKTGTMVRSVAFQDWFTDVLSGTCPSNCLVFDPWVAYDQLHGRFLFLASVTTLTSRTFSYLLLSVSNGATFATGWKNFALPTFKEGSNTVPYWGDSWRLGFDNQAIYLAGNMFDVNGAFQYAKIRVLKMSDVYNPAATTLPYQDFGSATAKLMNANGTLADSIMPTHQRGMPGPAGVGLLVSATTIFNSPPSFLTVWKIANPLATPLTMTPFNIGGLMPYSVPANPPQLGGQPLNVPDNRVLKAIYRNGFLYTARNSGYSDAATTVTYDVIDTNAMAISSQGRLLNTNAFYPAFDVPATVPLGAQFATASQISGTTTSPTGTLTFPGITNLRSGDGPYVDRFCPPCRWGDYFGGSIDPINGGLWASGEYAPASLGTWATQVGYFPWLTTPTFSDVPSTSPYSDFINVLNLWGITTGCGTNPPQFCPTSMVTRDQFATFIIRSMLGNNFTYTQTPYFTDVPPSSPYFRYIQKLADIGLTHGCTPTTYCPTGPVLRQDAAVLLVRGKLESLFGDSFTYPTTPFFTDVPSTSPQFSYIQKISELGITTGCSATTFCPTNNLTRQDVAVFLVRAFLN